MLDFIDWLTHQDFGRRCILSVRDVLSWVDFLNAVSERDEDGLMTMGPVEDEEMEWDLRLDWVTAFIHAACLVYIDSIGSGEPAGFDSADVSKDVFGKVSLRLCRNHGILCRRRSPGSPVVPRLPAAEVK